MSNVYKTDSEIVTLSQRGYNLTRILGEGSYAKVYLASFKQPSTDEKSELACKIVDASKAPKDFIRKFLPRELDILIKLNHPHIIHVHSIFLRKNKYFIFMRHAELGDLLEYVSKNGAIHETQARVWFRQMSLALQYLHDMEIAHRDLKCENTLITKNYNVKIADFGFARSAIENGKLVRSETYCGSLSYAAPEILRGQPYYPKISDIWSMGIILYVMLNKAMPFDDNNAKKLHDLQINKRWKFRSKIVDALSEKVKRLVTNLLEPDLNKRLKVEQILTSEWMAMDPRLLSLNAAEQAAKQAAITAGFNEKRRIRPRIGLDNANKKNDDGEEVKVLKEASLNHNDRSDSMKIAQNEAGNGT